MTIGPQKDEKDDKSPKRWQTLEKMTTDNSEIYDKMVWLTVVSCGLATLRNISQQN